MADSKKHVSVVGRRDDAAHHAGELTEYQRFFDTRVRFLCGLLSTAPTPDQLERAVETISLLRRVAAEPEKCASLDKAAWAACIENEVSLVAKENPEFAKVVREDILFTARQLGITINAPAITKDGAKEKGHLNDKSPLRNYLELARQAALDEAPHLVSAIGRLLTAAAADVVEPLTAPPPRLSEEQLAEFRAYAKAHPWPGDRSLSPSEYIAEHYKKWLGKRTISGKRSRPTLRRSDLARIDPVLAEAYSQEIRRHPERVVGGLYTQPHKQPVGIPRAISARPRFRVERRRASGEASV
ncbi:MAG: hypothetical protein WDN31_02950 [Hyphomicrobium sp.]